MDAFGGIFSAHGRDAATMIVFSATGLGAQVHDRVWGGVGRII
jgi:hypothetical protein